MTILTSIIFHPPNNHCQSKQFYSQTNQFNLKELSFNSSTYKLHYSILFKPKNEHKTRKKTPNSVHIIYYHHIFNNNRAKTKKLHQNALAALHLTFHSMHLTQYHFSCDQFQSLKWSRKKKIISIAVNIVFFGSGAVCHIKNNPKKNVLKYLVS